MKAFFRTPTGQSVIAKMPIVMQQNMQGMQGRMADMIPRIQQIEKDMGAQLQAQRESQAGSAPSQSAQPTPQ